ncbi:hypothetical protein GTP41_09750 [Pseudoduganella sp. DS3]|uniref:AlgX/AlgJ SGNH hydrolase-like domain-containing protein n=1 Tax=Pseudoduganella guangdongensis TaxID=2692179 RepID=A0A6N9HH02_9BURK|nr:hypothetical protein [Pseudoduganella guangdongensis]MYN02383.1 hypothetical protein [Pseudoduganella guangdongensis]
MSADGQRRAAPAPADAAAAPAARPRLRLRRLWRKTAQLATVGTVLGLSTLPLAYTVLGQAPGVPLEELRPLAPLPTRWEGPWHAIDHNYAAFERWFSDNAGLRTIMVRSKNELDYQLFGSSRRVYYGSEGELFNRSQTDIELPHTEEKMADPQRRAAMLAALDAYAKKLQEQGVTLVLLAPISKHYTTGERLPYFAPRLPAQSNFMAFYDGLRRTPSLNFIDVDAIQRSAPAGSPPPYLRQDFHWTDVTAMDVAAAVTNRIAELEGSPLRWRHAREYRYVPFQGVEARFAGRLNTEERVLEPELVQSWTTRHTRHLRDAQASGLEFETGTLDDPALLPSTCLWGNSFSDGMLRAGMPEHYRYFRKISRHLTLPALPALARGHCKYLVAQALDIQAGVWQMR